ncbi:MAG TPA: biotin carboxylase N-terminal domain-containing protein [Candidatus Binatia bacterium]|nr:biotin carboxylase N-terminal domain-containing protein [Candidatus Binatia bacterium]
MIRRLLIANRGEIAIRIARAARERGIAPLGIYSEADARALHVRFMDQSRCIGPPPAQESYLDAARIIDAARELGADAIHPGYGFLSEQAAFAQMILDEGFAFVGPPPAAIAAVGSKIDARRRARALGIPVIAGYDGGDQSLQRLRNEAERLGPPVMIKASAGGGGRGMRVVADLADFDAALTAAKRESLAAFGDDAVLLERAIPHSRHVEIQILGDQHGNIVHIGERECSVQRRHQKIVEEAPSPAVDEVLRAQLGEAAAGFARDVGYENAGTVEFLMDENGRFYFLEMNARLQVEHAVTELVYGIDLVGLQLDVAAGDVLPLVQGELQPRGWAVEARIYAEDPARDFAPSAGTIERWEIPGAPGIRVDAGVERGSDVSFYYDALLAKVIAHSFEREPAIARLATALSETRIEGVTTNLPLLRAVLDDQAFRSGEFSTALVEERRLIEAAKADASETALRAAAYLLQSGCAWRIAGVDVPLALDVDGQRFTAVATRTGEGWQLRGDIDTTIDASGPTHPESRVRFAPPPRIDSLATTAHVRAGTIAAPMPGKVIDVAVRAGDAVPAHGLLLVLEAMKMEHRIEAPLAGTVSEVLVECGALVKGGAPLVRIE